MNHRLAPYLVGLAAACLAVVFAMTLRLPLPFDGFAALAAASLAFFTTLAVGLALPARYLWSDDERLRHAFRTRHGMSDTRAGLALDAITAAHARARTLRGAATGFVEDLRAQTEAAADTFDAAARDIFYDPETLATHRATLVRSELVEEAVTAHARLRDKARGASIAPQVAASREKVAAALASLEDAFKAAEERAANKLLTEVDASSATAETLLRPRGTHISSSRQ